MMSKKGTKHALLLSVLSLLLCCSMLIGTTFAWFTDSVTSAGNKIQAGKLDIELWLHNGTTYEDISDSTDPIFGNTSNKAQNVNADTLWEPGKTQVAYLAVHNAGSLDMKYTVGLLVKNSAKDLYKVMSYAITPDAQVGVEEVTSWNADEGKRVVEGAQSVCGDVELPVGATHYFALSIHMDETAGNEYQEGLVEFDMTVIGGQLPSEEDSFGKNYDDLASYPGKGYGQLENGASAVEIDVINDEDAKVGSFVFPAESLASANQKVSGSIEETDYVGNFTVDDGMETKAFEITVEGLKEDNDVAVKVQLRLKAGMDPATVKIYHYDTLIDSTYDPEDGLVTFSTATFSPFTAVFDAESVYVAPTPLPEDMPKASVTPYEITEPIEWGKYGDWSPTEGLEANLETAYTFTCTETLEEAKLNPYANWHCDFVVKLDKDLGENQIFLGGNYGTFGWVGFHNGELTLEANTEIPLLGRVTKNPWTYVDVVQNVKTFICGVGDVDDALSGATFTVMLRLTNPDDASEFYNLETINYKFP